MSVTRSVSYEDFLRELQKHPSSTTDAVDHDYFGDYIEVMQENSLLMARINTLERDNLVLRQRVASNEALIHSMSSSNLAYLQSLQRRIG